MIDKARIQTIHADLQATLKAFADKHNLTMSPFGMTYSATGCKFAVQLGDKDELGDADPILAKNTARFGNWYGLTVEDIGKGIATGFKFNAVPVVFEGMKNKNTVIYRTADGKRYRTDAARFATANGRKVMPSMRDLGLVPFGS